MIVKREKVKDINLIVLKAVRSRKLRDIVVVHCKACDLSTRYLGHIWVVAKAVKHATTSSTIVLEFLPRPL